LVIELGIDLSQLVAHGLSLDLNLNSLILGLQMRLQMVDFLIESQLNEVVFDLELTVALFQIALLSRHLLNVTVHGQLQSLRP
jgi:hypothetical protein